MTTYIPAFEPQHDEGLRPPLTNCNPASAAMMIDHWTYGRIDTSDVAIRQASGISPTVGMNYPAVNLGIGRLFPELGSLRYSDADGGGSAPMTWAELRTHLANGGGAMVAGFYVDLPTRLRRWSPAFEGGHQVFVADYRPASEDLWWMDPMGGFGVREAYGGERIPLSVLWDFIWRSGSADDRVRVTAAHSFSAPRPPAPVPSRFSDVPAGASFYDAIERMAASGVFVGYGDGTFRPNEPATRGQIAAALDRFARAAGIALPPPTE